MEDHNQRPLFAPNQVSSGQGNETPKPRKLRAAIILNTEMLNSDIKKAVMMDQALTRHLNTTKPPEDARWTTDINGHLRFEGQIFVPEVKDLRLCVLKAKHDHVLAGHPGQVKTLQLICRDYTWPNL